MEDFRLLNLVSLIVRTLESLYFHECFHGKVEKLYLEGGDREGGREMQEGGDMGIYVYV